MEGTGNYYFIAHLRILTSLTDRTIRNYIVRGDLQGEMINGLWHFTPEQVEAFINLPAVRAGIAAKQRAMADDFLLNRFRSEPETCLILDLPGTDRKTVAEYFCCRIGQDGFRDLAFSLDVCNGINRVILTGRPCEVLQLVNDFAAAFPEAWRKS